MTLPHAGPPIIESEPPRAEYTDLEGLDEVGDEERAYWLTVLEQSAQVRDRALAERH
jgi:hypothetical protein